MCDWCYEKMKDDEDLFGFHVTDIHEVTRLFKGHKMCVDAMAETFRETYGDNEGEEHVERQD